MTKAIETRLLPYSYWRSRCSTFPKVCRRPRRSARRTRLSASCRSWYSKGGWRGRKYGLNLLDLDVAEVQDEFPAVAQKDRLTPRRRIAGNHFDFVVLPVHGGAGP